MKTYQQFLAEKSVRAKPTGFTPTNLGNHLFPFQKVIVEKALASGKYAIFADCGLGKTLMQLEWADQVAKHTKKPVLILAPLAVSRQTQAEGEKFGITVTVATSQDDVGPQGIYVTNYEKLHKFEAHVFGGVVLDESSIIKHFEGKTRTMLIEEFADTPYKLACTATPSPNDFVELGNHCEFLNVVSMNEMLSLFFINDIMGKGGTGAEGWRLKRHAAQEFWKFVGSWATMIQKPSDLGFPDEGFALPPLKIHEHILPATEWTDTLFPIAAETLTERREARKGSLTARVEKTKELVAQVKGQCLVWCDYNSEADALAEALPSAIEVRGADTDEKKEETFMGFAQGTVKTLISKASITGWGMNYQNCSDMVFCGISDSYEQWYQAIRRSWRFGQKNPVNVHLVLSEKESAILENIKRKKQKHETMFHNMVKNIGLSTSTKSLMDYKTQDERSENWTALLGDCVDRVKELEDSSIGFSIYSPPFASLYTYTNSEHDMGNCKGMEDFVEHFQFLIPELMRVLKPGRLMAVHCMNLPTSKMRDGYIGLRDFRGDLLRMFMAAGFIYHSEVTIWKDPVVSMQRTKALGLLHKQIKKDSSMSRQGLPDYLIVLRKPGENPEPIGHTPEEFPVDEWQKIASPVWMDVRQSNTLQRESAREAADEKHICPLQLDVIERALYLWSNPGDLVLSPFMGIGSEGYVSLKLGRKFVGIELKKSYYDQAVKNLKNADAMEKQLTMFS